MKYSNDNIIVYSLYPDIYGKPAFLFYVDYPRNIRIEGIKIARLNFTFIILGFIVLIFTVAIVLEYSVIIPVHILNKQVISIIAGEYSSDRRLNTMDELGMLSSAIDDMAVTIFRNTEEMQILNRELEILSITDALTSAYNRRHFDETIRLEWERACRAGEHISLVMCDIDYFKRYNDYYGHQAGDDILVMVADALKKCMKRMTDRVYRYGGEEFIIILPNTDISGCVHIAETLLRAVRALKISHADSGFSDIVTISTGCASVIPPRGGEYSYLVSLADRALYEAKHNGRNRIYSADTSGNSSVSFTVHPVEE